MEDIVVARLAVSAAVFAIDKPYDYIVQDTLKDKVFAGTRVFVPFGKGNRRCEGIVLALSHKSERQELKCIDSVLDETPVLEPWQLKLALWMHDRFFCTVYDAIHAMLPAGMWYTGDKRRVNDKTQRFAVLNVSGEEAMDIAERKKLRSPKQSAVLELLAQIGEASTTEIVYFTGTTSQTVNALEKQGLIYTEQREVYRRPEVIPRGGEDITLTDEQQAAFAGLCKQADSGKASAALLFGVTGSGKTSVYIELIKHVILQGKTAIILVPEIALTPQLMSTFAAYFENDVALLHSALGMGERYDEWKRIKSGKVHVVVGTRSAIFAPLENLGLVILDEEQEHTYKSDSSPRYHAREIAKYRCAHSNALLLLGSATPSIESMYYAKKGIYEFYSLKNRYNRRKLPDVIITDMKKELKAGNAGDISSELAAEIEENLRRGEQAILFLNRRGASSLVTCCECGYVFKCPNCSVSQTYHSANRRMMCHYCGHSEPAPDKCPVCGGQLKFSGTGTQRVEEELKRLFPDIGTVRMDLDTVSITKSHEKLLSEFRDKNVPVLLGTQMVAKGLDFENVTLVGVISADSTLYMNDYRASERTFSLLTQVVGRSGRGEKVGRAVIQTFTPKNEVIELASRQDYEEFYKEEIELRAALYAPPFSSYYTMTCSSMDEAAAMRICTKIKSALLTHLKGRDDVKVLGPAPAPIVRINSRFHYRITLVCKADKQVRETVAFCLRAVHKDKTARGVVVYADTEPEF